MSPTVKGIVVSGNGEGRQLGYPTANLSLGANDSRVLPGVYAAWVHYHERRLPGILISGVGVEAGGLPRQEVYLLDFSGELYGEELSVEVIRKMRELVHGIDVDELRRQIEVDIISARQILGL